MADLFTQLEAEKRYGSRPFKELLDDDGDGVADASLITELIGEASSIAKGILENGWTSETQLESLAAADPAVKGAAIDIYIGLCGRRRPEFLDAEGSNPYVKWQERGEKKLNEIVSTKRRSKAEATVGKNALVGSTRVNVDRTQAPLTFVPTKDNPRGPGGF